MGRDLVKEFISPDFRIRVKEVLDRALQGEETANFEFPLFTKNQERVEVLLNATSRRDASGAIVGMVGVGQDITDRVRAELENQRVRADLRLLIDSANAPIFGIDKNGLVNEWNLKSAAIVGYTSEEVMGHDLVAEFISPEFRESVKAVLDRALHGEETANYEFPLFTKNQERVEVLLNATTRRDAAGAIVGKTICQMTTMVAF
jgi:PAS domain S-box-containing protein